MASGTPYWQVRALREDEVEPMYQLSVACFAERANTRAFIQHRYFGQGGPRVMVAVADAAGQLIGSQAVTFLPFHVAGRQTLAGMFTDGMTHPGHRKKGIFRALLQAAEGWAWQNGAAFLFTMPNDESLPAFAKSPQWHLLPDRRLFARPVQVWRLLADRGWPRPLAAIVGGPVDGWLRLWRGRRSSRVEELTGLASAAADLDRLADEAARALGGVMCRRDYAFLRWRFEENPTWRYRYFVAREAGRVQAYAITTTEQRFGTTISYVADMLAGEPDVSPGLLGQVADVLRADGTRLMGAIISSPAQATMLKRAGYHRVPAFLTPRQFHTAYALGPSATPEVAAACTDHQGWFLSLADFDTI